MNKLAMVAVTAIAMGMGAANASDLYRLKVEYVQGENVLANYSGDVPLGVQSNFVGMQTREFTTEQSFVDEVMVTEVKSPFKTGFMFNGLPTLDSEGDVILQFDYLYSRLGDMDKTGDASFVSLIPRISTTTALGTSKIKLGEKTTIVESGGHGIKYELKVMVTKL